MKLRRAIAVVVFVLAFVNTCVFVSASWGTEEFSQHVLFGPVLLAYPGVALVVLWRRSHPVAWVLLVLAVLLGPLELVSTLIRERPTPIGTTAGWRFAAVVAAMPFPLFATLLPALGLRFPNGELPTARWRWVERAYAVGVVCVVLGMTLAPTVVGGPAGGPRWVLGNPLSEPWTESLRAALELVATVTLFPAILLAIASVVVRFRRSTGVERQQMRWLSHSLLWVLLTWPVAAGVGFVLGGDRGMQLVAGVWSMAVLAVPAVAIGVAVTRYRLYDLDRVISRTLSYAIVVAVLVGLYAGSILGLSAAARALTGESGDLVVALSTLLVVALFQPVRGRVQRLVERRFNRRRYDAQQTLESFGRSLRDELDGSALTSSLRDAAARSLQPRHVSVHLVSEGRTR